MTESLGNFTKSKSQIIFYHNSVHFEQEIKKHLSVVIRTLTIVDLDIISH